MKEKAAIWIYVAGPMRGQELFGFPAFDSAAAWLREDGYKVISPAELDRAVGFDPAIDDTIPDGFVEGAMRRDVEALLKVDGVALLPGWETSAGVKVELAVARGLGLPVWELLRDHEWDCPIPCTVCESYHNVWDHLEPLTPERQEAAVAEAAEQAEISVEEWLNANHRATEWPKPNEWWPLLRAEPLPEKIDMDRVVWTATGIEDEVRITDPSGGAKGSKPARFDMIPPDVLAELATHYGKGEAKYPSDPVTGEANWQKGYAWHLSAAALQRHLFAWLAGEDIDPETGSSHLIPVIWHAIALRWFQLHDRGTDDLAGRRLDDLYIDQAEADRITNIKEPTP